MRAHVHILQDWKENKLWVALSFPSLSSFSTKVVDKYREVARVKMEDWVSWSFVFLKMWFCVGSKFWLEPKGWPLLAVSSHRSNMLIIYLLWVHWHFVLLGHRQCSMQVGQQQWQVQIAFLLSCPFVNTMLSLLLQLYRRLKVRYCQSSDIVLFQDHLNCYRSCTFPHKF